MSEDGSDRALTSYSALEDLLDEQVQPGSPWSRDRNLKLERIQLLAGNLGNPQHRYPTIHVGGTSGKGTVAAFTAAILSAHGLRTGLHLSPYVQALTETWQLDGRYADPAIMLEVVTDVIDCARANPGSIEAGPPSYFEIKVAAAFELFARQQVDAAVIEVGVGGALDATNVLGPGVKVLTSVGLDHTDVLGSTVEEIAKDKIGIFQRESTLISGVRQPAVREIVRARAAELSSPLYLLDENLTVKRGADAVEVAIAGKRLVAPIPSTWPDFQVRNAALAIAAADATLGTIDEQRVGPALASVLLPARFEIFSHDGGTVILDGAHNVEKIEATLLRLRERFPTSRISAVFALKEGKDVDAIVAAAAPFFDSVILTTFEAGQWEPIAPQELKRAFENCKFDGGLRIESDPRVALRTALDLREAGQLVLVIGSLYLAGNVRDRWYPLDDQILRGRSYEVHADG